MGVKELRDKQATIRQLLIITDGCSNVGEDPVTAATQARQKTVVVNVIGIVDKGDLGKQGRSEAMSIAEAGGGMCRLVQAADLAATAQMMTHQTMQMTLQQVVNQQLLQVVGKTTEDLPPAERTKVMQLMDKLEEEVCLELVVALDTSASMREKMPLVQEAVRDLTLSLQAREGDSRVAVVAFPGNHDEMVRVVQPFSDQLDLSALESVWTARGGTPTGPAISFATRLFDELGRPNRTDNDEDSGWTDVSLQS
ncbi:MAG: hypothetical protein A2201_08845 [Alicyclobacillus sp. RIFOXYA1_FULL_53_8]|nr:MAG: hypothetical protein A2201_08845 [Alicyclobacillus sp. RIFOXYA1_FULL_53_8]